MKSDTTAIYLCDNDSVWLNFLEQVISGYLVKSNWDFSIALSASSPSMLIQYLEEHIPKGGVYFLDAVFEGEINGFELGQEIRRLDPDAALIYATFHDEMMPETFRLKLQALDYILKDQENLQDRICQCLSHLEGSCPPYHAISSRLVVQAGSSRKVIPQEDIYYIYAVKGTHKVQLHTKSESHTFSSTITSLEQELSHTFVTCCRGMLVNSAHIVSADHNTRELLLDNGEKCPCSFRMWHQVLEKLSSQ